MNSEQLRKAQEIANTLANADADSLRDNPDHWTETIFPRAVGSIVVLVLAVKQLKKREQDLERAAEIAEGELRALENAWELGR